MKKLLLSLVIIIAAVAAIIIVNATNDKEVVAGMTLADPPPPSEGILLPEEGYPYYVQLPNSNVVVRYNYALSEERYVVKYQVNSVLAKNTYVFTWVEDNGVDVSSQKSGDVVTMYGTLLERSPEGTISAGYRGVIRGQTLTAASKEAKVKVIVVA